MPWYYAGPNATPVGPLSLEELNARRLQGEVTPETYIIEQTGQPTDVLAWRRYREVFPGSPVLPPMPPTPPVSAVSFPTAPPFIATSAMYPPGHAPVGMGHHTYVIKPTNSYCAWGFGLGLTGFFFSFACGIGLFLAVPSLLLCILGLSQVSKNHAQAGKGLAITGLVLSSIALLISLGMLLSVALPAIRTSQLTVTEQTSNDSE
jgi:hypothetical protein